MSKTRTSLKKRVIAVGSLLSENDVINALRDCIDDAVSSDKGNFSATRRLRKKLRVVIDSLDSIKKECNSVRLAASDKQKRIRARYRKAHAGWKNKNNRVPLK